MESQKIRRHYQIYGRVQGVGFRFRAIHVANHLGLTGWVRNEYDGSVSIEAQGSRAAVDSLLPMIENSSYIRIDRVETGMCTLEKEETGFSVRY